MFYLMPGILFSGLSWPPFAMESFARVFSCIIPFRYVGINMRDLLLAGYAPDFWQDLAVMFCAGGAALTTAIFLLRRRRKEAAV